MYFSEITLGHKKKKTTKLSSFFVGDDGFEFCNNPLSQNINKYRLFYISMQ